MPSKLLKLYLFSFLISGALSVPPLQAQVVYQHVSSHDIYSFIDELASARIISVNSAIRPYSRMFIASRLAQADTSRDLLNTRQKEDLDFFLRDFNKELRPDKKFDKRLDLFYYKDTLFTFSINPILGLNYYTNDTGNFYRRWNGAEAFAYIGNHFGFYASLRDHYESRRLSDTAYLNQYDASNYKANHEGGGDFDEMRGGLTYSWKWGSFGIIKDHFVWGDNEHGSNILSGHQPSYTALKLNIQPVKWLDFNYLHGWLVSDIVDTINVYPNGPSKRIKFRPKYLAANLFTVTPWEGFRFSLGNSVIYSDDNVHPAYLVPFFFYKTIDHSLTSAGSNYLGQNSQFFFNVSSRNIRNLHLYSSLFIDEIALGDALDSEKHSNLYSLKLGAKTSNLLVDNLFVTIEYTRTNPIVYRHYLLTGTYASSGYNMGHYLGDNAEEIFLAAAYRPIRGLFVEASMTTARKGESYLYTGASGTPGSGKGKPFIAREFWSWSELALRARYQIINDLWVFAGLASSEQTGMEEYTMPYFRGKKTTINFGANVGF
jgi:hypothetical protein